MKVFSWLLVLFAFVATAHADEKIDAIIDAFSIKKEFLAAIEEMKPLAIYQRGSENISDRNEMFARHSQEKLDLFNKYINWENIRPDFLYAIKSNYSEEEIDAFYEFLNSEHGSSFFGKYDAVGQSVGEAFSRVFTLYGQEISDLYDKHQQEIGERLAELEKEAEKEDVAPRSGAEKPNIGDIVRFMVRTESGQMVGYNVSPGRMSDLFEKSPFQEGDIVLSMNGIVVNEPSRVREAYEMLKEFPQVHFEVRRNGQLVDFVIDIIELVSSNG